MLQLVAKEVENTDLVISILFFPYNPQYVWAGITIKTRRLYSARLIRQLLIAGLFTATAIPGCWDG